MRIDRVILRAVLSTLAAVAVLCFVMIFALCLLYPSTVMQLTYDLGMDETSVKYAIRAYERTDEAYYAAFGFETAIGIDDDVHIEKCGLALIADTDEFATYCQKRNEALGLTAITYDQYVYGQVAVAQYRMQKTDAAMQTAFAALETGSFPENNAVVALFFTALRAEDSTTVAAMQTQMNVIRDTLSDTAYLDEVLAFAQSE